MYKHTGQPPTHTQEEPAGRPSCQLSSVKWSLDFGEGEASSARPLDWLLVAIAHHDRRTAFIISRCAPFVSRRSPPTNLAGARPHLICAHPGRANETDRRPNQSLDILFQFHSSRSGQLNRKLARPPELPLQLAHKHRPSWGLFPGINFIFVPADRPAAGGEQERNCYSSSLFYLAQRGGPTISLDRTHKLWLAARPSGADPGEGRSNLRCGRASNWSERKPER